MKRSTVGVLVLGGVLFLILAPSLAYYLPSTERVHVSGTEVKRLESAPAGETSRDIRYVMAKRVDSDESLVFRNEDTRWGWPPYFKFNASDISAEAMNIAQNQPKAVVLVSYYGVRSSLFGLYPNITSLKVVPADYSHLPIFNIVFVVLLIAALILAFVLARRWLEALGTWWGNKPWKKWMPGSKAEATPPPPDQGSNAA